MMEHNEQYYEVSLGSLTLIYEFYTPTNITASQAKTSLNEHSTLTTWIICAENFQSEFGDRERTIQNNWWSKATFHLNDAISDKKTKNTKNNNY